MDADPPTHHCHSGGCSVRPFAFRCQLQRQILLSTHTKNTDRQISFSLFSNLSLSPAPNLEGKKRNKRERDPNCCLVVIIELVKVPQFTRPHRSEWWAPSDWLRPQSSATLEPFRHRSLLLRPSVLLAHGLSPAKGNSFFHHIKVT